MKRSSSLMMTIALILGLTLSGCGFVADGPFGWLYTETTTSVAVGTAKTGSKNGQACSKSYMGLIATGDASIRQAMENGGVKEIYTVDKLNFSFFGVYSKQCTIVKGE